MLGNSKKDFSSLTAKEILALAIQSEEEDGRIYLDIAEGIKSVFPDSAKIMLDMSAEENQHRHMLLDLFQKRFGDHIPLVRRSDIKGFITRKPIWLLKSLGIQKIRDLASTMEAESCMFYRKAASQTSDVEVRKLLEDLATAEQKHESLAERLETQLAESGVQATEDEANHKLFVLQIVQPALAGLMDGSVSTLAPLFAAAFATGSSRDAFAVGLAASIGAGISMGFAEALSDDGALTGRGHPWVRGAVCGAATTFGGIGHTLPYLLPNFTVATSVATIVVLTELFTIAWIRYKYMETKIMLALFQVVLGGLLVFATGYAIRIWVPGSGG